MNEFVPYVMVAPPPMRCTRQKYTYMIIGSPHTPPPAHTPTLPYHLWIQHFMIICNALILHSCLFSQNLNKNIPSPPDHIVWPKLNQSELSIASTTIAPQQLHSTVQQKGETSKGPVAKPQSAVPPITQKQCSPRRNIVFFKMHKCSSSTVQNILFRYGDTHDLDFVIPPAGNYLGHSPFNKRFMIQLPTKEYNIFCHHTRFSEDGE